MGSLAAPFTCASANAIALTASANPRGLQCVSCLRALSICHGAIPNWPANSNDLLPRLVPETLAIERRADAIALVTITGSVPVSSALRRLTRATDKFPSIAASATSNPVVSTLP